MRKRNSRAERADEGPPRLFQVFQQLRALQKRGLSDPWLEDEYRELRKDEVEVALTTLWESDMTILRLLLERKAIGVQAIDEALNRTDLTNSEGLRLYMANMEESREMRERLQQEQKLKKKPPTLR
jgi:hypothetical protein